MTPRVTIRHLLTHTGGIDRADDFTDVGSDGASPERYVNEVIHDAPLLHPSGHVWSYNNAGLSLLGRVIEVVDGVTWDDALLNRIVRPLDLSPSTQAWRAPNQVLTMGHRFDRFQGRIVTEPLTMTRSLSRKHVSGDCH